MDRGGALVSVMGSSPLHLYAQEYFKSLNSIAQRISTDVATTVAAYEDLWHTLSVRDQHQVVNETIIYPEVVLKYSLSKTDGLPEGDCANSPTSWSYLDSEDKKRVGSPWPDEHGTPFSWRTRSQQNLSVFGDDDTAQIKPKSKSPQRKTISMSDCDGFIDPPNIVLGGSSSKLASSGDSKPQSTIDHNELLTKIKSKAVVLKIHPSANAESNTTKERGGEQLNRMVPPSAKLSKTAGCKLISKPKNPPPPPPPKLKPQANGQTFVGNEKATSHQEDSAHRQMLPENKQMMTSMATENGFSEDFDDFHVDINTPIKGDNLPKTGFDFLDNW